MFIIETNVIGGCITANTPRTIFFGGGWVIASLQKLYIFYVQLLDMLYHIIIFRVFSPVRERADNLSLMKKTLFLHSFYEITK